MAELARIETRTADGGDPCPECGAPATGGRSGCELMFHEIIARDFGDYRYFAVHRLVVDTYALQHPDPYCRSAKSLAAHLTGLCCAMEYEGRPQMLKSLQAWLSGPVTLKKPQLAFDSAEMTVANLLAAGDVDAHIRLTQAWGRSVWEAWSPHHDLARNWIQQGMGWQG